MSTAFEPNTSPDGAAAAPEAPTRPVSDRSADRFMRRLHGGLHARAPEFDTERVGPGGGMILMTL
ncbi:MAG: hypothetical protein AAFY28_17520, partial [Actinomycetota bacterium]